MRLCAQLSTEQQLYHCYPHVRCAVLPATSACPFDVCFAPPDAVPLSLHWTAPAGVTRISVRVQLPYRAVVQSVRFLAPTDGWDDASRLSASLGAAEAVEASGNESLELQESPLPLECNSLELHLAAPERLCVGRIVISMARASPKPPLSKKDVLVIGKEVFGPKRKGQSSRLLEDAVAPPAHDLRPLSIAMINEVLQHTSLKVQAREPAFVEVRDGKYVIVWLVKARNTVEFR